MNNGDTDHASPGPAAGVSPYSTGGGGVTLERRVAALYLTLLLTGDNAPELGADRHVVSVAFQQARSSGWAVPAARLRRDRVRGG